MMVTQNQKLAAPKPINKSKTHQARSLKVLLIRSKILEEVVKLGYRDKVSKGPKAWKKVKEGERVVRVELWCSGIARRRVGVSR